MKIDKLLTKICTVVIKSYPQLPLFVSVAVINILASPHHGDY